MKVLFNKYGIFIFLTRRIKTGDMVVHFQSGTLSPVVRPQLQQEDWNGWTNSSTGKRSYYKLFFYFPFNPINK